MEDALERTIPPDRPRTLRPTPLNERTRNVIRTAWRCVLIAAGVLVVVVPFGYAASGDYVQVVRGAGYGLVVGLGVSLHTQRSARAWLGLLVGSVVGMVTVQILAELPPNLQGPARTLPTAMALTMALVDGFGEPRLQGYREAIRESCIVSLLFTGLSFLPGKQRIVNSALVPDAIDRRHCRFFTRTATGGAMSGPRPGWFSRLW